MNTYLVTYIYRPREQIFSAYIDAKSSTAATRTALASFKIQVSPMSQANHLWILKSVTKIASQLRMAL